MTSRTTDQIAVVAPIPSASVVTAKIVKARAPDSRRHATTRPFRKPPTGASGPEKGNNRATCLEATAARREIAATAARRREGAPGSEEQHPASPLPSTPPREARPQAGFGTA